MLYLPRELHAFLLQYAIEQNVTYYEVLRRACFTFAKPNGFKHKCRANTASKTSNLTVCMICGETLEVGEDRAKSLGGN